MPPKIKTYDTESFRETYVAPEEKTGGMLKPQFGRFFLVRVQDMIRLMKLPVPPTRVTAHSLLYLTEGSAEMTVGGDTHTIHRHEFLFVPAGQIFSIGNVDVDSGKGYLCSFHDEFMVGKFGKSELLKDFEFLRIWGNPRVQLQAEAATPVQHIFERMLTEYTANGLQNPDILQSYFIAILCETRLAYQPAGGHKQAHAVSIANRFRELVFEHFRHKHLVSEYADMLNVSPNHLNKSVKTATGKSPGKWIDDAIVLEAKVQLSQSGLSVSEIASQLGFLDASYFSRLFKRYEKMSPLAFRRMIETS